MCALNAYGLIIRRYVRHLEQNDITDPLSERFTLGFVLHDLCELAETRPPVEVGAFARGTGDRGSGDGAVRGSSVAG
jgi:hypothetical protein